jgi:murein DD-endopeptidase MepM/ murein hydrolase activator NlpD
LVSVAALTAIIGIPSSAPANRAQIAPAAHARSTARPETRARGTIAPDEDSCDPCARRFTGLVGANLSKSLLAAGVPEAQARDYVALIARAIPLANGLSVDDRFDLILMREADGRLGQLAYAGLDRVARSDLALMKWTDGEHTIWVNDEATYEGGDGAMRMPVQGRLTSGFGERFHPILGYERFHDGVDLAAPTGTPIVAAADGRVVSAGWTGGYGQAVEVAHAGGLETRYGHMSRIAAYSGEMIRRGQVIGFVGSTGLSTGPHLHFEVMKNGRPVNPLSIRTIGGAPAPLEGEKRLVFDNALRKLLLLHS